MMMVGGLLLAATLGLLLVPGCQVAVSGLAGDFRLRLAADHSKPGVLGTGTYVPEFFADVLGRPWGLGLVLVPDQPQRAVGPVAQVCVADRAQCPARLMPLAAW